MVWPQPWTHITTGNREYCAQDQAQKEVVVGYVGQWGPCEGRRYKGVQGRKQDRGPRPASSPEEEEQTPRQGQQEEEGTGTSSPLRG